MIKLSLNQKRMMENKFRSSLKKGTFQKDLKSFQKMEIKKRLKKSQQAKMKENLKLIKIINLIRKKRKRQKKKKCQTKSLLHQKVKSLPNNHQKSLKKGSIFYHHQEEVIFRTTSFYIYLQVLHYMFFTLKQQVLQKQFRIKILLTSICKEEMLIKL